MPDDLRGFIHECIPHVDAAELLLLIAAHSRGLTIAEICRTLQHSDLSEAALERYLARFGELGLVACSEDRYSLAPDASKYSAVLAELRRLYNEQPVTLVRMIYAPRDERLRAFADAFKIKKS